MPPVPTPELSLRPTTPRPPPRLPLSLSRVLVQLRLQISPLFQIFEPFNEEEEIPALRHHPCPGCGCPDSFAHVVECTHLAPLWLRLTAESKVDSFMQLLFTDPVSALALMMLSERFGRQLLAGSGAQQPSTEARIRKHRYQLHHSLCDLLGLLEQRKMKIINLT
eukprot:1841387-Amphidinium_carterae.1